MFKFLKSKKSKSNVKVTKLTNKEISAVIGGGEPVIGVDISIDQIPGGLNYKVKN